MFYRTIAIKHLIRHFVTPSPTGEGLQIHLIKNIGITIYCTTRIAGVFCFALCAQPSKDINKNLVRDMISPTRFCSFFHAVSHRGGI